MEGLRSAIEALHGKVESHDRSLAQSRRWTEENAKRILAAEARASQHSIETSAKMRQLMEKAFEERFPAVLESQATVLINARMIQVDAKIQELQAIQETVRTYLTQLEKDRPQEGQMLDSCFADVRR